MKVTYANEISPKNSDFSIFLAGPSPRESGQKNWRKEALQYLENKGFQGNVFSPLPKEGFFRTSYTAQVDWETEHLEKADLIVFWVPRDLEELPGFTTNVEFGLWCYSGKILLGYPPDAPKMKILHYHAQRAKAPIFLTLEDILDCALEKSLLRG